MNVQQQHHINPGIYNAPIQQTLTTNQTNKNNRFSKFISSPEIDSRTPTISLASLNVRGINIRTKFFSILDDLIYKNLSIISFQETRLPEKSGIQLFKEYKQLNKCDYQTYWSFDPQDRSGGVGMIVKAFIAKYIQKVHRLNSRIIAIDFFFPNKKLRVIIAVFKMVEILMICKVVIKKTH